jgi:phenylalanyl-tRNA synthetase beta chain
MKFSYNWLKELSGTNKSTEKLSKMVMLKGFELEEVDDLKDRFQNFVVGEIKRVRQHKDADNLQVALVSMGDLGSETEIVCGAANIYEGMKVPVALPGAVLPQSKMEIKERKIRGEKSKGMLCSEDELGIGKDKSGILELDKKLKPGTNLAKALDLNDKSLDFDILPNRAHDCLSHRGMAREICAMEGVKFKTKDNKVSFNKLKPKGRDLKIEVKEKKSCPRYMAAVLKNIQIQPSPNWIKTRLLTCGLEPINNVVDITNYVMLETGNPLHAFDKEKIDPQTASQKNILIRRAKKGEKLELLDDSALQLSKEDLVIADSQKPLALAGIKGGKNSGVNKKTSEIILEAATFNALNIRKTRQRHGIQTDSQARFEKNISPALAPEALSRAITLLEKYAGAKTEEVLEQNFSKQEKEEVEVDFSKIEKLLGFKIGKEKASKILDNLGFELKMNSENEGKAKIPYWRMDIEGSNDLTEEVGRIIGYDQIKPKPLLAEIKEPNRNEQRELEWKIKDLLSGLGFDEMINYSFYGDKEKVLSQEKSDHLELENPIASDKKFMRKTLLPGLAENVSLNRKNFKKFSLFEIARVYSKKNPGIEPLKVSGACFDREIKKEELFFKTKGAVEALLEHLTNKEAVFLPDSEKVEKKGFFQPKEKATIYIEKQKIGEIGLISLDASKLYKIKEPVCLFELDLETIAKNIPQNNYFQEIPKFPSVSRDLAIYVPDQVSYLEIQKSIQEAAWKNLQQLELFDTYQDQKNNRKSLAFHLKLSHPKKTLSGEEADKIMDKIIKKVESTGAEVRKN